MEPIISFADAKKLDVERVQQAKDNWCWAAASEMVGTYNCPTGKNQWDSGGGHAMVIAGYSGDRLLCIDPWGDTNNYFYSYSDIKDGGEFATGTGKSRGIVYYK